MADPRFTVSGNDIVFAETHQPVTVQEFNKISTPEEKDAIDREFTARALKVNQSDEKMINEDEVDADLAAPEPPAWKGAAWPKGWIKPGTSTSTPSEGLVDTPPSPAPTESSPAPVTDTPAPSLTGEDTLESQPDAPRAPTAGGKWKPPTLETFLEKVRPENPEFDDVALAKEYRKLYPEAAELYPAPKKDEWVQSAQKENPDYSPLQLKQYYDDIYGTPPPPKADVGWIGTVVEGAKSTWRSLKAAGYATFGNLEGVEQTGADAKTSQQDTALQEFLREASAGKREDESWFDAGKRVGSAVLAHPKGAIMSGVQQLPNVAVIGAGVEAGMLAGAPLGPGGVIAGGIAGLFLSEIALETGGKALEKADNGKFTPEERRLALEEGVVKGAITAAIDLGSFGATRWVAGTAGRAVESATARTLTDAGIDIADKAAVSAAAKSPEIAAKVVAAQEAARVAVNTLGKKVGRAGAEVLSETVGESAGEYLGELAATGKADKTEALIEGLAGFGQSAVEIGVANVRPSTPVAAVAVPPPSTGGAPPGGGEPPEAPIAPIMAQPDVDAAIKTASTVVDAPITATQLNQFLAPDQGEITKSTQQANLERIFSGFEPSAEDVQAGFTGFQRTEDGAATFNGVPLKVLSREELPLQSAPESPVISQQKYDVASLFAKAFDKELVIYQNAPGIPDGVVWRQLDPNSIYLSSESTSADTFKVIGHELMHFMEGTELHDSFRQVVTENLTAEARSIAAKRHGALDERGLLNEIGADLAGSELSKEEVWQRVFQNLSERVGTDQAKTEVLSFIDSLKDVISRIRNLIAGRPWTAGSPEVQLANAYVTNLEKIHDSLAAVVSDALAKEPSPTTSETAPGPQTMGDREIVHPEAVAAFTDLAERQRGEPELAMRDLKDFLGGGVLSPAIEHAGDLIHRVTEASRFGRANRPLVAAKVEALVQTLGHAYGFEREHQENLKARAKALRLPVSKVRELISTGLARYAAAQKALPVYNRVHWLMRETARAIGESRFADALTTAKELQALTKSKQAFDRAAFTFARGADQKITQYTEPLPVKIVANKAGELDEDTLYQLTTPALGKKAGETVRASVLKDAGYLPQPVDLTRHGEAKAVEGVAKQSPQADLTDHPAERRTLSTTVPAGKKGDRNAYTQNWIIGTEDILASESHTKTLLAALHDYPMMSKEKDPKKAFAEFKRKVVVNLLWLHDLVPAEARERAKRWYDGANRIATEWAAQDGYTENQHAGVLAVLSPQKDWFMNVSLADRVRTIMKEQANNPWTQEMTNWAEMFRVWARTPEVKAIADKFVSASQRLEGQILKTLSNEEAALFIRAYDQTYHERSYRLVTPEGGFGEYVTNKQETEEDLFGPIPKVKGTVAWGSQRFIEKAVSILRDGSNKNISEQLGSEHKVRNFYNNILHPDSAEGHVTIDTHAMGAALIKAVSGGSLEVKQLFGAAGSNVWTGASGSYGLVADAYREAAKRRGLLPREMQSITWEAVRGLFPWSVKKQLAPKIDAVWEDVRNGKITLVKAREKIFAMSGGINRFAWEQGGEGLSPANGGVSFEKGNPNVVSTKGRQFSKRGGVPGSQGVLSEPYRPYQGTGKAGRTLDGLPALVSVDGTDVEFAGFKPAQDAAAAYMAKAGLPYQPETVYHKIDKARAARIAAAYDAMPHTPQDPEVKAAYDAMVAETLAQYEAMLETGIVIEFNDGEDPYGNPRNAILDVIENNHMYVFSTREGFGSNVQFDPKDNPLLAETKFKFGDKPTLANDIFRAVHDYFGHVKDAVGFRAEGEDNAWYSHARMFSPLARRAMTTETRGQNSWVNYGPHGETNRKANPADTIYADQKTGLLPEWVMEMDRPQASRANLVHYSKEKGLSTIDPVFHGTGQIGAERTRMLNEGKAYLPRTYFYRAGTKIEPRFKGQTKYQVQVDEDSLVDLAEFSGTASERERAAKDAGYKGYYNSESAIPNVVAMFTPVNVGTSAQVAAHSVSELRSDPLFSPRTWVSQIEKVLELKMPKSASAAQIKGILSPNNGIKPDELEAMGIEEYLASKEKFDKHNVLEWVKAHQIQTEQVTFSDNPADIAEQTAAINAKYAPIIAAADAKVEAARSALRASSFTDANANALSNAYYDALEEWKKVMDDKSFARIHATEEVEGKKPKYDAWQLKGGKNYKEVFVTLPDANAKKMVALSNWRVEKIYGEDYTFWEVRADRPNGTTFVSNLDMEYYPLEAEAILAAQSIAARHESNLVSNLAMVENFEESARVGTTMYDVVDGTGRVLTTLAYYNAKDYVRDEAGTGWSDGHDLYSEVENPVVRLRMNDRVTPEGQKLLFLEEVQPPQEREQAKMPKWALKRWREIALKQALRLAAEGDYDAIGWTTGEQQADRYSLRKVVSQISWRGSISGMFSFRSIEMPSSDLRHNDIKLEVDETGKIIKSSRGEFDGEALSAVIGDAIASRVLNEFSGVVEGDDLRIGGQGIMKIYDKDLVNATNSMGKKWGVKVGKSEIWTEGKMRPVYKGPSYSIEELQAGWEVLRSGPRSVYISPFTKLKLDYPINNVTNSGQLAQVIRQMHNGMTFEAAVQEQASMGLVEILGGELTHAIDYAKESVHTLPVTDAMKAVAMEGVPLFSRKQTESPEFKAWFGNSKVVNEDGSPKVVYHGTERGRFTVFQTPSFFTEEKAEAIGYATLTDVEELPDIRYVSESAAPPIPDSFDPFTDYVPVATDIDVPNRIFVEDGTERLVFWDGNTNPVGDLNIKIVSGVMAQNDKPVRMPTDDRGASHPEEVRARQVVRSVYLSIQNPVELPWNEANLLGKRLGASPETVKARVAELQKQGYDGIITESDDARIFQGRSVKQYIPFEPTQIKSATENTGAFDLNNKDIRFAPGAPRTPRAPRPPVAPTFTVEQPGWLDKIIRVLQDKNIDIKRVVEALQATGRQLAEDLNPVLKEEMYLKRAEQKSKDFTTDEMIPLTKAMKLMGVTLEQMDHYLQARHIVRDNLNKRLQAINPNLAGTPEFDRLAGMTDQQAQGIVNQYARLEPLARKVDDMVDKTRDLMVSYGLEKQSTIDAWRAAYGAYVPLRREGFEDEGYPSGTGRSVRGSTVKQRLGSGLEATNILANVAQARDQVITRGEKTRPVVAMAGLLMMHPNSDLATLDKPAQIQITDPVTGVVTTVPGNLTNYQVPMVRRVDPRTGMVGLFPDPTYKGRDNVVNFRVNGEDFAIVFNERNPRAMEVAKAFKDTDTAQLTGLMAMVAPYTRYLASINTQYNPIFGIVNFVRDSQFAMLALQTTPLKDKKAEVMANTISSLRGIYQDARAVRNGQHPTSATAQMWERFQHVGGPTGYRDLFFSSTERAEEIEHLITPMTFSEIRSAKDFGRRMESTWAMQVLSDYNLTMENSIRLGVFTTAVNMGISDLQAASYAKNITVNFNKRGQIGAQMGSLYAFFNANVQGTARIFETLFERTPTGVTISAAGKKVIAGGLLLGALQTFALAMAGFGDDQPPEYIKARNIIIPMPGTEKGYVSIPMPLGFNLLPNIGRAAAETVKRGVEGKPLKLMSQMSDLIGSFYGTFSPLGGSGGIVQELMPTTVDPIVSAFATNKDWTGKSIAKEDVSRLDPTPGHTRARDTATVWATALSKAINWATGGTEHSAGVLSPTPDTLDYLIQQATGGVGREISKTAQVVQSQITGEELPFYKVPLLGRFGGSATGATAVRDDFYTRVKDVNIASREFAGRVKDKDPSAREFIRENPEARLKPAADQIERKISDLQKLKHEDLKRGASADRIQQREKQITNLMLRFNQLVDRVRAGHPASE